MKNCTTNFSPDLQIGQEVRQSLAKEFEDKIHLRIFKRTAKKSRTTIENLPQSTDFKTLIKKFKQMLSCNGSIDIDKDTKRKVIILQGDHRKAVKQYLIDTDIVDENHIIIHGF